MIVEHREDGGVVSEATVKLHAKGERVIATAEGNGPVNALDQALRSALEPYYPELAGMELADYKVRILEGGTAPTRSPGCWWRPATGGGTGPRSACTPTSSRRPGSRSPTRSSTGCWRCGREAA